MKPDYRYKAKGVSAYDADTIRVSIDLGFGITMNGVDGKGEILRLNRIDAPEMRGFEKSQGVISRDYVREIIIDRDIIIETIKDSKGKYGRYLAEIYYLKNDLWINLNNDLVKKGLAKYRDY